MVTRILKALLAVAVVCSVALVAPPAGATPVTSQSTQPVVYKHRASVSKAQMRGLRIARTVILKDTKGKVLDYRKSKKHWARHTTYRRQFAGAWIAAGGKVTHISKAERKRVNRWVLRAKGTHSSTAGLTTQARNCTGDTVYYRIGAVNYYFYDSCKTNDFKRNVAFCMTGAGFAAAAFPNPGVAVSMALLIAGCAATGSWISTAQENSDKNAILVITQRGYDYNHGRYIAPVIVKPQ